MCDNSDIISLTEIRVRKETIKQRGRFFAWDVVNELHGPPWSNQIDLDLIGMLDTTKRILECVRQSDPQALRVVNFYCPWESFQIRGSCVKLRPIDFTKLLLDHGVPVNVFGLQCYIGIYPFRNPEEVIEHFLPFENIGVPIFVSELSVPSNCGIDKTAEIQHVIEGTWNECNQAKWIYDLVGSFSKLSAVSAISFWDLADYNPHFWPFGGLFHADMRPKESWYALGNLFGWWSA